jgi:CysZ protein
MIKAFSRAIAQLSDPRMRRVFWIGVIGSLLVFTALWGGIAVYLSSTEYLHFSIFGFPISLDFISDILGNLTAAVLAWLLFPTVITLVASLFLEDVAAAVEDRHYRGLAAPRKQQISETLWITFKFTAIGIVLNILALPFIIILIFFPPFNLFVFYGLNGYLLGREYFELVGHRRFDPRTARRVRRRFRGQVFVAGVLIAILLTVPFVNLIAPIIATAAMVHLLHGWRDRLDPADQDHSMEIRD